jgi:hypothetical protein
VKARPVKALTAQAGMKFCGKCQKELPKNRDFFDQDKEKEDGFKNWCKTCRKERRDLAKAKEAAEMMKTLDLSVLANLADAKPGGTTIPHVAEVYQNVMALMGGVQGYAMHLVANFIAAPPGGQIRQRIIADIGKMGMAVSDSNKVSMPSELMTDDDLETELKRREERMKILPGTFTDVTNEEGPEQPDAGRDAAAG